MGVGKAGCLTWVGDVAVCFSGVAEAELLGWGVVVVEEGGRCC